jgi:flavin-dependent dehydrogenase
MATERITRGIVFPRVHRNAAGKRVTGHYDAIIVGAGPGGSTAAILLAAAGWSVALIEKQTFPRRKVCGACIGAGNFPLLATLGIGEEFARVAGPELREVGLYRSDRVIQAPFPAMRNSADPWGRALGRETFDLMLLKRAQELGATVWQPCSLRGIHGRAGAFACEVEARSRFDCHVLRTPVLIMANGSWERDPGGTRPIVKRAGDLFAFKATFSRACLQPGVLPVISFEGGYGGLVIAENGVLILAGCIRRDVLKARRTLVPGQTAGEAFEGYLRCTTGILRDVLRSAQRESPWLGSGPIRTGIRSPWRSSDGQLMIGNAAAEAHPIIGEGISMAMQSAWLLCSRLIDAGRAGGSTKTLRRVSINYASQWKRTFAPRVHLAAVLAHLAMKPSLTPLVWPLIGHAPRLLTTIARGAGKARAAPGLRASALPGGP